MTMVFKVADTRRLNRIEQGHLLRFVIDNVNAALTVTATDGAK